MQQNTNIDNIPKIVATAKKYSSLDGSPFGWAFSARSIILAERLGMAIVGVVYLINYYITVDS